MTRTLEMTRKAEASGLVIHFNGFSTGDRVDALCYGEPFPAPSFWVEDVVLAGFACDDVNYVYTPYIFTEDGEVKRVMRVRHHWTEED